MYICKATGDPVYETLDEILDETILKVHEDTDFYYVQLKPTNFYDNTIWKVNKNTEAVSWYGFTSFLVEAKKNTTPIEPKVFKRQMEMRKRS